jgi:hypothetical protein
MSFFLKSFGLCVHFYLFLLPAATFTVRQQQPARFCRLAMELQPKLRSQPEPQSMQQRSVNHILTTSSLSLSVLSSSLALIASRSVKADDADTATTASSPSPKAYQTRSGLRYIDKFEGTGISPQYGQLVAFNYEIFYRPPAPAKPERVDWTTTPFLHKHGNGRICRGIDEALHTMRVGGRRRAILTPEIGLCYYSILFYTILYYTILYYTILYCVIDDSANKLHSGYTEFGVGPLPADPQRRKRLGQILDAVDRREGDLVFDLQLMLVRDDENDQGNQRISL